MHCETKSSARWDFSGDQRQQARHAVAWQLPLFVDGALQQVRSGAHVTSAHMSTRHSSLELMQLPSQHCCVGPQSDAHRAPARGPRQLWALAMHARLASQQ